MAKPAALDCCWTHSMTLENVQLDAYPEWILPRWVHRWSPVYGGSSILSHLWTSHSSWIACPEVAALLFQTHTHMLAITSRKTQRDPFNKHADTLWQWYFMDAFSMFYSKKNNNGYSTMLTFFLLFFLFFLTGYKFLQHNKELIPILLLQSYFTGNFTLTSFSLFSVCLLHGPSLPSYQ